MAKAGAGKIKISKSIRANRQIPAGNRTPESSQKYDSLRKSLDASDAQNFSLGG
jgi:hypothetical protein